MEKDSKLNDFDVIARLGEGSFGQVFKVKRKSDGVIYALKKIKTTSMPQKDKINALNQVRILASYEGEHIIGYKDSFYDDASGSLCIVLEFAEQGDLQGKISKATKNCTNIPEDQIWKALVHLAKGLRTLHSNKVLHRDLKSANIFITADGTFKLGDLNISKVLKRDLAQTQTGTPYYASPEIWKNKPYGSKSDMWSLGCVLYEMAAQKPPFTAGDMQGLYRKITIGSFARIPNFYSNQLSEVINSLLKLNPDSRPSTEQLLAHASVLKNYKGELVDQSQAFHLLRTIKPNKISWKDLNFPKPKYDESQEQKSLEKKQRPRAISLEKMVLLKPRGRLSSETSQDHSRLSHYLQTHRDEKQKEKYLQLKKLYEERKIQQQKRERILSACGAHRIRKVILNTPRVEVETRCLEPESLHVSRKVSEQKLRLPPRPRLMSNNSQCPAVPIPYPKHGPAKRLSSRQGVQRSCSKENIESGYRVAMGDSSEATVKRVYQ